MIPREDEMFASNHLWCVARRSILLALASGMLASPAVRAEEVAAGVYAVPNALLSIDQNRRTVVDRIVADWSGELAKSAAGITADKLREMLFALRADQLLAASLAGSLDGLHAVLTQALSASPSAAATGRVRIAALGDTTQDLTYTPVTPCRLFDTRVSQGGLGTPTLNVRRTYGAITPVANQGGPGGCAAGAGATVAMIQIGTLTPSGNGLLQGGPQGAASFPNALILYQSGDQYGTGVAMPLNPANGQFDLVEQFATADLFADLLGYFAAPAATAVQCTSVPSAGTTIAVSADTQVAFPACTAGFTRTGTLCAGTNGVPSGYLVETNAVGCVFRNLSSVATYTGTATSVCCRVP
jgi:hypothetical protein